MYRRTLNRILFRTIMFRRAQCTVHSAHTYKTNKQTHYTSKSSTLTATQRMVWWYVVRCDVTQPFIYWWHSSTWHILWHFSFSLKQFYLQSQFIPFHSIRFAFYCFKFRQLYNWFSCDLCHLNERISVDFDKQRVSFIWFCFVAFQS